MVAVKITVRSAEPMTTSRNTGPRKWDMSLPLWIHLFNQSFRHLPTFVPIAQAVLN